MPEFHVTKITVKAEKTVSYVTQDRAPGKG